MLTESDPKGDNHSVGNDSDNGERYELIFISRFFLKISFLKISFDYCLHCSRRIWTDAEDQAIRDMVARLGTKSWAQIAENLAKEGMPGRSGKQCRERWHNHLGKKFKLQFLYHYCSFNTLMFIFSSLLFRPPHQQEHLDGRRRTYHVRSAQRIGQQMV